MIIAIYVGMSDNNTMETETMTKTQIEARLTELKTLARDYDKLQNDGGEGYNPHRDESSRLIDQWLKM